MSTLSGTSNAASTYPSNANTDSQSALSRGNRSVVTDHYFNNGVKNESELYRNKIYVRLGASKNTVFEKISFTHCIFEDCYLPNCVFDTCNFTGCKFVGSNLYQSTFAGCKFWYTTFERTQIDDDILIGEAPIEENLRIRFARTLRMNFTQLGDAKAVNKAISVELEASEQYLRKSWSTKRSHYYKIKYPKLNQLWQFFRWLEFKFLDIVWGNGESILKLARSIGIVIVLIAIYGVSAEDNNWDLKAYWQNFKEAPGIFLGVVPTKYPTLISALIGASRYVSLALFTTILVKRFGRR